MKKLEEAEAIGVARDLCFVPLLYYSYHTIVSSKLSRLGRQRHGRPSHALGQEEELIPTKVIRPLSTEGGWTCSSHAVRYVLRRLLTAIPTLFVIVTMSFFLIRVAPGGPFNQEKGLNPVIKANLERQFGLDLPLWKQYLNYLNHLLHGNFGPSYNLPDFTVGELFGRACPSQMSSGPAPSCWPCCLAASSGCLPRSIKTARPIMLSLPRPRPAAPFPHL